MSDRVAQGILRLHAIVPAAGTGSRFGGPLPKQYQALAGVPVLVHSLKALLELDPVETAWVVVAPEDQRAAELLAPLRQQWPHRINICPMGGATRRDSVLAGLEQAKRAGATWVMVHDAARPLLRPDDALALIEACLHRKHGGILARPVVDTVKRASSTAATETADRRTRRATAFGARIATVEREGLWLAQTPQMFPVEELLKALKAHPDVTDECAAIERAGGAVFLLEGSPENLKLTSPEDLEELERQWARRSEQGSGREAGRAAHQAGDLRIGQGVDVHALVPGRPLLLGGVPIPHPRGLLGHSDADVLLHAITDALLGAAGLGDIGTLFPDQDPQFKDADSRQLLRQSAARVHSLGWSIANLDCTVIAQAPRLAPYREAIVDSIAACLGIEPGQVNMKAKTQEWLGFEGRGEGISAQAVVLLRRDSLGP